MLMPAKHSEHYAAPSFWRKLTRFAKRAGYQVVEKALWLFYAAESPATPAWAKTVIYGALGYFIMPADAVPDVLPGIGFTDDLTALLAAISVVASYITPEVKRQARETLEDWFGGRELRA